MSTRLEAAPNRGLIRRFSYWFSKRRYKRVLTPVGVRAHDPYTLIAFGNFELVFERANSVDKKLKMLAQYKAAQLVECGW